jgi:hypothetical protein
MTRPAAPKLSSSDVSAELSRRHARDHRTLDLALYGSGDPGRVLAEVQGAPQEFEMIPVRCELALREALSAATELPRALLVDFTVDLPRDLEAAVAGGKIHIADTADRLARRFTAREAARDLLASPLRSAILQADDLPYEAISGARLEQDVAWRAFLQRYATLERDGALALDRLLAFAAEGKGVGSWASVAERFDGLAEAWRARLEKTAGAAARFVWEAWERGAGRHLAKAALLVNAVEGRLEDDQLVLGALNSMFKQGLGLDLPLSAGAPRELALELGRAVDGAVRRLGDAARGLIDEADALVQDPLIRERFADSRHLPSAFATRQASLAAALVRAADKPGSQRAEEAHEAWTHLSNHGLARLPKHALPLEQALMAVRLVAYLAEAPDVDALVAGKANYEAVVVLARHYAADGGFVDYARRLSRGAADGALGAAIAKVAAAADRERDAQDERFAKALPAWLAAGKPSDRVVPIEHALDRFAAEFLASAEHRRLLLVVLDGMSWANAVELLEDLQQNHRCGPIRWRMKGAAGAMVAPPVLAALPTQTNVSRSALFAGASVSTQEIHQSGADPERFARHKRLAELMGGTVGPKLLMKGDLHSMQQATALVMTDARVVGVVVNTIDDQLKGSKQLRVRYTLDAIKPLRDLMTAAEEAGRAVMLVADHGHVSGARMQYVGTAFEDKGTRWRALKPGEEPKAGEVEFAADRIWCPPGIERLALLYRETDTYGTQISEGEHGGATLSEVIAPAFIVAADTVEQRYGAAGIEDAGVSVGAFPRPLWWDLVPQSQRPRRDVGVEEVALVATGPTKAATKQLGLWTPPEVAAKAPQASKPGQSRWATMLLESGVFAGAAGGVLDRLRREVIPGVDALAAAGGRLPKEQFAASISQPDWRLDGIVTAMSELLNVDGYPVIDLDRAAGQVVLEVELMEQLFGAGA